MDTTKPEAPKKDKLQNDASTELDSANAQSHPATIRKWFFYILIVGLIVSAVISIIAVLIGEINDVVTRALWTTFIMVLHSLIAVGLLSISTNKRNPNADEVALNILVGLTIASFVSSALGTWGVLSGAVVSDLYKLIFYALFADLLIFILLHSRMTDRAIARSAMASIGITVAFFIYLIPNVFTNSLNYTLPDIYNRGVAAFSILLSTAVVITIVFHWIYRIKHADELESQANAGQADAQLSEGSTPKQTMPLWAKVVLIVVGIVFGLPIVIGVLGGLLALLTRAL